MDFKQFYKTVQFDIDKEIRTVLQATQGDTKSRGLIVPVVVNSVVTPITTETMNFFALKPDGTRIMTAGVKDGDKFRIDFTNQTFSVAGTLLCALVLYGTNGEKIADKKFKMTVDSSLEDGAIISEDERGILDRAFDLANDIVPRLEGLDVPLLENVNNELETKADKDYVDGQDALKADKATTYLRTEIDAKDALKADKAYTDAQLALKADLSEIEVARGAEPTLGARLDADKAEVSAQLEEIEQDKAEKTDIGLLSGLLTTAKTSIVAAINELFNNKANKVQEPWIVPTLLSGTGSVKYRKTQFGQLEIVMTMESTSYGSNIITLPSGYRPINSIIDVVSKGGVGSVTGVGKLLIATNGGVQIHGASDSYHLNAVYSLSN